MEPDARHEEDEEYEVYSNVASEDMVGNYLHRDHPFTYTDMTEIAADIKS